MKIIHDSMTFISSLLGEQQVDKKATYRLSSFCHIVKTKNVFLLYNNFTKQMVSISEEEKALLDSLPSTYNNLYEKFISNWFLFPIDFDEHKLFLQIYDVQNNFNVKYKNDYIDNFVIFTTLDCNARCYYCFEHGWKRTAMTLKTAIDVANYIIKHADGKKVTVKWFGGEPLYNMEAIKTISHLLNDNNIDFVSKMTTNGYLFNEELIEIAKNQWHLNKVQITLDGMEETYNRIKNYIYKTQESAFKIVINNIKSLINADIKVSIRLNLSSNNISEMYSLVDYLFFNFSNNLNIYASNLFDFDNLLSDDERKEKMKMLFDFNEYLCQKGYGRYDIERWNTFKHGCMAQNKHSVTISPTGKLGRCEHFSDGKKMFGSIYDENIDINSYNYWYDFKRSDNCKNCFAFPNCSGIGHCPDQSNDCKTYEIPNRLNTLEHDMIKCYEDYLKKECDNTCS